MIFIFLFPLQSVLAAAQTYLGHDSVHEVTSNALVHFHHDEHEDVAHVSLPDQGDAKQSPCETDHPHCHVLNVVFFADTASLELPPGQPAQVSGVAKAWQSHLSSRIERPKWA